MFGVPRPVPVLLRHIIPAKVEVDGTLTLESPSSARARPWKPSSANPSGRKGMKSTRRLKNERADNSWRLCSRYRTRARPIILASVEWLVQIMLPPSTARGSIEGWGQESVPGAPRTYDRCTFFR
jgi:hypothetical protein